MFEIVMGIDDLRIQLVKYCSHWSSRTFVLGRMVCRTTSGIRSCSTPLET